MPPVNLIDCWGLPGTENGRRRSWPSLSSLERQGLAAVGRATYLPQMRTPMAIGGKIKEQRIRAGGTSIAQKNFGFNFEREIFPVL
jgi:hypothetical protein